MRSLETEMRYARDVNVDSSFRIETDDIQECKQLQHLHTKAKQLNTPKPPKAERKMSDPIVFKLKRTDSEIQLMEDQEAAEYHDYCMFIRIAGGMLSRQDCGSAIDRSLDSVIRTHHRHDSNDDDCNNNKNSSRSRQSRHYQAYLPHSPDDIPGLTRTPSSIANTTCNAGDPWCSGPLPSLVDLIGHNAAAIMDCDSSVDEDIFMLDL